MLVDRILRATAFENCEDLFWRVDGDSAQLTFWINCNDLFFWACADLEQITQDNIGILEECYREQEEWCEKKVHLSGGDLFCCRSRKMRPQGAAYPDNKELWPLFDACGPEREITSANPHRPGKEQIK